MSKIKVLFIITALNIGGAEMMLYRLIGKLNRDLFDIAVVSLMGKGTVGEMIEREMCIPVYSLGISTKTRSLIGLISLVKIIRTWSPQIVHSHLVHANLLTRFARLFHWFPILVCSIHTIEEIGSRKSARWRELVYRVTDPLCDLTTQVSRAGLKKYIAIKIAPKNKIKYMPNGIDISSFEVEIEKVHQLRKELGFFNKYIFLAVGNLTSQKDYPTMLRAYGKIWNKDLNMVLIVVGEGPMKSELLNITKELRLMDAIVFLGLRKDIALLMNMADVFVLSSTREGLPVVLLEAASSKLPIIATDVGGNREIVMDRENGFIVQPGKPEDFAQAMLRLFKMPRRIQIQMGKIGYNHVKNNYSIDIISKKWESVYKRLLTNKGIIFN